MHESEVVRTRRMLLEAFTAGWQAGLAVRITHPRVLRIVESCFDEWLEEAADEVEVFGLAFRRRTELPLRLGGRRDTEAAQGPDAVVPVPEPDTAAVGPKHRRPPVRARQQVPA